MTLYLGLILQQRDHHSAGLSTLLLLSMFDIELFCLHPSILIMLYSSNPQRRLTFVDDLSHQQWLPYLAEFASCFHPKRLTKRYHLMFVHQGQDGWTLGQISSQSSKSARKCQEKERIAPCSNLGWCGNRFANYRPFRTLPLRYHSEIRRQSIVLIYYSLESRRPNKRQRISSILHHPKSTRDCRNLSHQRQVPLHCCLDRTQSLASVD